MDSAPSRRGLAVIVASLVLAVSAAAGWLTAADGDVLMRDAARLGLGYDVSADGVRLTLSGKWGYTCVPAGLAVREIGDFVFATFDRPASRGTGDRMCGRAETPWSETAQLDSPLDDRLVIVVDAETFDGADSDL